MSFWFWNRFNPWVTLLCGGMVIFGLMWSSNFTAAATAWQNDPFDLTDQGLLAVWMHGNDAVQTVRAMQAWHKTLADPTFIAAEILMSISFGAMVVLTAEAVCASKENDRQLVRVASMARKAGVSLVFSQLLMMGAVHSVSNGAPTMIYQLSATVFWANLLALAIMGVLAMLRILFGPTSTTADA